MIIMSIFNELLPNLNEISNSYRKNIQDALQKALERLDEYESTYKSSRGKERETAKSHQLTILQSINEDEDDINKKTPEAKSTKRKSSLKSNPQASSTESNSTKDKDTVITQNERGTRRASKKRSKDDVDGMSSPEQDKRRKRNASVKAQNNISKQVNVNLTQKLRREDPPADESKRESRSRRKGRKDKENTEPDNAILPAVKIKQEKMSIPPEQPMETEPVPEDVKIKQEFVDDKLAMPPPVAPIQRPRRLAREKVVESEEDQETDSRRTKNKKDGDSMPPPPVAPVRRSARANSRANSSVAQADISVVLEPRPKRTRAKKKQPDYNEETEKDNTAQEVDTSATEKSGRPKRTRKGRKLSDKQSSQEDSLDSARDSPKATNSEEKIVENQKVSQENKKVSPDKKRVSLEKKQISEKNNKDLPQNEEKTMSPILKTNNKAKKNNISKEIETRIDKNVQRNEQTDLDKTHIIETANTTVTLSKMDETIILPNGRFVNESPKKVMNETVILESRNTLTIDKGAASKIMDETVVISKDVATNITDDDSILTDDNSDIQQTPPKQEIPKKTPTSAVKEKVQQFEELASRVTRTKTRAMAKKEEENENVTPPDKIGTKAVLSAETLNKMNNLIFNGKQAQASNSGSGGKSRSNVVTAVKTLVPTSASKANTLTRHKEAADEHKLKEIDARQKKEAMLEAKKEQQKRKREEKMAAAAACREAAERDRLAAIEAAKREKMEKQAHADQGKIERQREVEKRRQELARKVAETEERRKAEEQARQQRLAEEQRRADNIRKKQQEEAEAMKKEAAIMAKEMEKRQKEYIEKQKLKQRLEADKTQTPLKTPGTPGMRHGVQMEPVYMQDGFQYLNSDEDDDGSTMPVPPWSHSKVRWHQLVVQSNINQSHIDRLFSVRTHTPDLREIFPNVDRQKLKRTSSAVWRTPPCKLPVLHE